MNKYQLWNVDVWVADCRASFDVATRTPNYLDLYDALLATIKNENPILDWAPNLYYAVCHASGGYLLADLPVGDSLSTKVRLGSDPVGRIVFTRKPNILVI